MNHEPTPWTQMSLGKKIVIYGPGGGCLAVINPRGDAENGSPNPSDLTNAKFIVRACNFHEELLEALKLMVSPVTHIDGCLWKRDHSMPCQCGWNDRINAGLEKARSAISKAEVKS